MPLNKRAIFCIKNSKIKKCSTCCMLGADLLWTQQDTNAKLWVKEHCSAQVQKAANMRINHLFREVRPSCLIVLLLAEFGLGFQHRLKAQVPPGHSSSAFLSVHEYATTLAAARLAAQCSSSFMFRRETKTSTTLRARDLLPDASPSLGK